MKKTILYVDDEESALQMFKLSLEKKGYTVNTFLNGSQALEFLKSSTPDLIIADLRMHPMNGFELYQAVRKLKSAGGVPFVFLTGLDDTLAKKYSETLGVDAYLTKPVDLEKLEAVIRRKLAKT